MPDRRTHRGPHPDDIKLFSANFIPILKAALADFSLLLTKGYADKSALKLVGDRFSLTERQRLAVMRSACSDQQLASRNHRRVGTDSLAGQALAIDGYNVLITVEAATQQRRTLQRQGRLSKRPCQHTRHIPKSL